MKIKELLEKYGDIEITEEKEKELKTLLNIKELLNIKDNKKFKPKYKEKYYFVSGCEVVEDNWYNQSSDDGRYDFNNCFKTKEEAEFRLEQIKVYNELKNFADENNDKIVWEKQIKQKYSIFYDYSVFKINVEEYIYCRDLSQIYFSSRELAEKAIEQIGKDRIKKYLFGFKNTFNSPYKKEGNYIYFGSYPQTIKKADVEIVSKIENSDYYLGSDGEKYVKAKANPCRDEYTFTNGEKVVKNNEYYFKVEPVKWKILSQENGEYFIFSDCILNTHIFDSFSNNYDTSEIKNYLNNVMYNELFSDEQKNIIQTTSLGKLFLLSVDEITNNSYGFDSDEDEYDIARRKKVTDYAIANNVWYDTDKEYFKNGWYWLRTSSEASLADYVDSDGDVSSGYVYNSYRGLAFALKITLW